MSLARRRQVASWLVRLLAVILVPIVVASTGQTARAAAVGPTVETSFNYDMGVLHGGGRCNVEGHWQIIGESPEVVMSVACESTGWVGQGRLLDRAVFSASGSGEGGEVCEASFGSHTVNDGKTGTISATITSDAEPDTCRITDVCFDFYANEDSWADDKHDSGCFVLDFGEMVAGGPSGHCVQGTPGKPIYGDVIYKGSRGQNRYQEVFFDFIQQGVGPAEWKFYVVQEGRYPHTSRILPGGDLPVRIEAWLTNQEDVNPGGTLWRIKGVGVVQSSSPNAWAEVASPSNSGLMGLHDPDNCMFYWGEKVAELPDTDADEPGGPFDGTPGGDVDPPDLDPEPPVPPADDSCAGFSFTDPSSWASAGICVLVKLVGMLIDAVRNVAKILGNILTAIGGLVGALLDGLVGLFVPSDGFFEGQFDSFAGVADESNLGEWKDAVAVDETGGDGTLGGLVAVGGGCAGPSFNVGDSMSGALGSGTIQPLAACDGTASQLANLSRVLLAIVIGIAGVGKSIRILTSALGVEKGPALVGPESGGAR